MTTVGEALAERGLHGAADERDVLHWVDDVTGVTCCGRSEVSGDAVGATEACGTCLWTTGLECPRCGAMQYDRKLCDCDGMRSAFPEHFQEDA